MGIFASAGLAQCKLVYPAKKCAPQLGLAGKGDFVHFASELAVGWGVEGDVDDGF